MSNACAILVTGLPGTGKTTLARRIAARYAVPLLAKDLIKEPLLDVLGASDAAQSRRLSDASFTVLFAITRELLAVGSSVLLEGNFRPGDHEQVLQEAFTVWPAPRFADRFCQVLCKVDEPERLARLLRRRADPARHPGHRDADLASSTPAPKGATFLDLPGARFTYEGADDSPLLAAIDAWWYSRTI